MTTFRTNVLRNGEWITEEVDLQTFLKTKSAQGPKKAQRVDAPLYGLLTKTVADSQMVKHVLPVRLRSPYHNDVAFIGHRYIQIREFQSNGQFRDILFRRFPQNIRNACVVGSFDIPDGVDDLSPAMDIEPPVKREGQDEHSSSPSGSTSQLPPQLLVLTMDDADVVFCWVGSGADGRPELYSSTQFLGSRPHQFKDANFGAHMAVDPSSRYMAISSVHGLFAVGELESLTNFTQPRDENNVEIVKCWRVKPVKGIIQSLTFLYPRPEDKDHIILLLIYVNNGKSKMVIYEWTLGDDLATVFSNENDKRGHRLPVEHQMPQLLIPLTVGSAFIAISHEQVAVCTECLHGPPVFESLELQAPLKSPNYYGTGSPLWTAWDRPYRLPRYLKGKDCLYLAREDGIVVYIEVDEDHALERSTFIDAFKCNISSAFAYLFDQYADVLVLGSDNGTGSIWKIPPRDHPLQIGTLPNGAPFVDFATATSPSSGNKTLESFAIGLPPSNDWQLRTPDRIFAASGHGLTACITEYRYGLKADIGLELEVGSSGLKKAWLLNFANTHGLYDLLWTTPTHSQVGELPDDFSDFVKPEPDQVPYDLSSPTLAVAQANGFTVQVSTTSITLFKNEARYTRDDWTRLSFDELLRDQPHEYVSDAYITDDWITVSTHVGPLFRIYGFKYFGTAVVSRIAFDVSGDVTSLHHDKDLGIIVGLWKDGRPYLLISNPTAEPGSQDNEEIDITERLMETAESNKNQHSVLPKAIESIASVDKAILLGTRGGELIHISKEWKGATFAYYQQLGLAAVNITAARHSQDARPRVLVSCDQALLEVKLGEHGRNGSVYHLPKYRVLPTKADDPGAPLPLIEYSMAVDIPCASEGYTPILMVTGQCLVVAELHQEPGPAHRPIQIGKTPVKTLFSPNLRCLVVGVNEEKNRSTLMFIDPETREDIGRAFDKTGNAVQHISGLGKPDDRIFGLAEWEYKKSDRTWRYLLVGTKRGQLIIVSTEKMPSEADGPSLIKYRTRFRKAGDVPVYSVVGHEDNVIYCAGFRIHWEVLDREDKKLKPRKVFDLDSLALDLQVSESKLLALTRTDSLQVIDPALDVAENSATVEFHDPRVVTPNCWLKVAENVFLVADQDRGVAGLWQWSKTPGLHSWAEFQVLFQAMLPVSIKKFRRGRTRPTWEQGTWNAPKYGRLMTSPDDAEILGISMDGTVIHFTLLDEHTLRLFRFITNLWVLRDKRDEERLLLAEPDLQYRQLLHVDGDLLKRILDEKLLQDLINTDGLLERLKALLDKLDGGKHTASWMGEGTKHHYFGLAYDVLVYYLKRQVY
ncbi:mono-functional DNA-alkylating methyl methanesulfonate N-term-domain-containing protein [Sordaria brevicollis]|uniref:Mono-functional DNA-alkylating methyl methanesulfonate N-term-domain-containing protein n=1 Tax=Sordaria brevicollis TaxID=83679 RepID=A0AAE0PEW4_SORBR|nr:mono-functional DNA-alkylating methyl methanesulfonate N-term-domain-containing protein [Sordaria brevicollis]